MADSCRTSRKGRKGRTKSDDATLSRGSSAKASATVRALRNPPGRAARNRRLLYCCSLVAVGRLPVGAVVDHLDEAQPGSLGQIARGDLRRYREAVGHGAEIRHLHRAPKGHTAAFDNIKGPRQFRNRDARRPMRPRPPGRRNLCFAFCCAVCGVAGVVVLAL